MSKSVSRVLSWMVIYLDLQLPADSSDLTRKLGGPPYALPYLILLQMGFTEPVSRLTAGELLPHLSTLTIKMAVYFCCTFLEVAFTGYYPASCPTEPGLSSCTHVHATIRFTHLFSLQNLIIL